MDRQRTQGNLNSTTGAIKEKRGEAVGDRHLTTEERAQKTDGPRETKTDPLDAVREVVNNED